ncbi:hypothetical protein [Neorhizobium sp. T6_25]|uniref:hypothetical protein n=1 Tax=Neorhizobium sp. T6_25 TaxID=2093833 RepID=UPI000CF99185|nr:hypothetical protein [Neorhizobium sp. T6_25]
MGIGGVIQTTVVLGVLWLLLVLGIQYLALEQPSNMSIAALNGTVQTWSQAMGQFISPILQLALILIILLAAAEKLGFSASDANNNTFSLFGLAKSTSVQAFIAVAIIVAVVIGALANIARIDVLKDLALVVVGFYFGKRPGETIAAKVDGSESPKTE